MARVVHVANALAAFGVVNLRKAAISAIKVAHIHVGDVMAIIVGNKWSTIADFLA